MHCCSIGVQPMVVASPMTPRLQVKPETLLQSNRDSVLPQHMTSVAPSHRV
jgi:hypothetical protein